MTDESATAKAAHLALLRHDPDLAERFVYEYGQRRVMAFVQLTNPAADATENSPSAGLGVTQP